MLKNRRLILGSVLVLLWCCFTLLIKVLMQDKVVHRLSAASKHTKEHADALAFIGETLHEPRGIIKKETCVTLLSRNGTWLNNHWRAHGQCSLIHYRTSDVQTCMINRARVKTSSHIALVGDSRMRDTFQQLASYFLTGVKREIIRQDYGYTFPELSFTLSFFWDTYMDGNHSALYEQWLQQPQAVGHHGRPDLVIDGIAAWMRRYWPGRPGFEKYRDYLTNHYSRTIKTFAQDGKTLYLWKLQDPTNRPLPLHENYDLFNYNQAANKAFHNLNKNIVVWSSSVGIASHYINDTTFFYDGLHYQYPSPVQDLNVQLLFNVYCNEYMDLSDTAESCC